MRSASEARPERKRVSAGVYLLGVGVGAGLAVGAGVGVDSTGAGEGEALGELSAFGEGDGLDFAVLPFVRA